MHHHVEFLEEINRFQVFAAAELVGQPFAVLARVIEINHGSHRIHAQAVDVELADPEMRVGEQEIAYFIAAVVEDQRAPVLMFAQARILVFVQGRAVEARQRPAVLGEMRRHPVQNHADAGLVAGIDKGAEIVRRAEAAGDAEIAGGLVAPGFIQRMLADRHQLDVGVAHFQGIGHQIGRQFAEIDETVVLSAFPRAGVEFVHVHRLMQPVLAGTLPEPCRVAPCIGGIGGDAGGSAGPDLEAEAVRVGLDHGVAAVAVADFELVQAAHGQFRDEHFPHAARAERAHGVDAAIPAVEVADDADALRVRRPQRKTNPGDAFALVGVGAQHVVGAQQPAFAEQMQVVLRSQRRKGVGIVLLETLAVLLDPQQAGAGRLVVAGPGEHAVGMGALHFFPAARGLQPDTCRLGQKAAHHGLVVLTLQTQPGKRIVVPCPQYQRELRVLFGFCRHGRGLPFKEMLNVAIMAAGRYVLLESRPPRRG
ncbi:hypothetical protein GALL_383660 [mine drainage metagenome]|uniref:Uncharacterized protein n=1 Tax=mine drainage metagenome TaxID=410659 RepID=A0A1J5QIT6_9ZZZZ